MFFLLLPERIPKEPIAWFPILVWYIISILLLKISKPNKQTGKISGEVYGMKDFVKFMLIMSCFVIGVCLVQDVSYTIVTVLLLSTIGIGVGLFLYNVVRVILRK